MALKQLDTTQRGIVIVWPLHQLECLSSFAKKLTGVLGHSKHVSAFLAQSTKVVCVDWTIEVLVVHDPLQSTHDNPLSQT